MKSLTAAIVFSLALAKVSAEGETSRLASEKATIVTSENDFSRRLVEESFQPYQNSVEQSLEAEEESAEERELGKRKRSGCGRSGCSSKKTPVVRQSYTPTKKVSAPRVVVAPTKRVYAPTSKKGSYRYLKEADMEDSDEMRFVEDMSSEEPTDYEESVEDRNLGKRRARTCSSCGKKSHGYTHQPTYSKKSSSWRRRLESASDEAPVDYDVEQMTYHRSLEESIEEPVFEAEEESADERELGKRKRSGCGRSGCSSKKTTVVRQSYTPTKKVSAPRVVVAPTKRVYTPTSKKGSYRYLKEADMEDSDEMRFVEDMSTEGPFDSVEASTEDRNLGRRKSTGCTSGCQSSKKTSVTRTPVTTKVTSTKMSPPSKAIYSSK